MGTKDRVIWTHVPPRRLSYRSFRRSIFRSGHVSDRWKGLCELLIPLKVKCFVWLVLRDRVVVRDRILKLGIVQTEGNVCPLCNEGVEDLKHIFVHCDRVYRVWARNLKLWNLNFVGVGDARTTFNFWFHTGLAKIKHEYGKWSVLLFCGLYRGREIRSCSSLRVLIKKDVLSGVI